MSDLDSIFEPETNTPSEVVSETSDLTEIVWDEPIPFPDDPSADAPVFPIHVFPEEAQRYARTVAGHAQAPTDLACSNMLGVVSASVIGKATIESQPDLLEQLALWVASALPSGERKTSVQRPIVKPVYEIQRERIEAIAEDLHDADAEVSAAEHRLKAAQKAVEKAVDAGEEVTTAELAAAFRALDEAKAARPTSGRIIADDATPEGLLRLFEDHEEVFIAASEGGLLDTLTGIRYGKVPNLDLLNKSHDGDPHSPARGSSDHGMIERPLLAMTVSPQPDVLRELAANETLARRGTLARFLFTLPPSVIGSRTETTTPLDSAAMAWWAERIRGLFAVPVGEGVIRMLPKAKRTIEEWRRPGTGLEARAAQSPDSRLKNFRSRLHGEVYRLAAVLHLLEHGPDGFNIPIGTQTAEGAVTLGAYYEAHAEIVYSLLSEDEQTRKAKTILAWLENRAQGGEAPATVRNICNTYHWSVREVRASLAILEERALYRVVRVPTGGSGRPSEIVIRNPQFDPTKPTKPPRNEVLSDSSDETSDSNSHSGEVLSDLSDESGDSGLCSEHGCDVPGAPVREGEGLFCTVHAQFYGLTFLDEETPEERAAQ